MKYIPILFSTPMVSAILDGRKTMTRRKTKLQPGDVLWVRETFANNDDNTVGWFYKADYPNLKIPKWKPGIHMPKEACRIFLKVTGVKVERLQDISPMDAVNEGVEYYDIDHYALKGGELIADFKNYTWVDDQNYEDYHFPTFTNSIDSFRSLWQSINGVESWNENPWVWCISFERIEKPENFI